MNKSILVAVYGSLLSGLGNHRVMSGSAQGELVGSGWVDDFKLWPYAGKAYHCVTECDGEDVPHGHKTSQVAVEVYAVDEEGVVPLDRLERYPSFYDRKQVSVLLEGGEVVEDVWIYYHHEEPQDMNPIEHGDWKEYIND